MKVFAHSNEKVRILKESVLENASYKLVALFISLILWLSILGRRDFVVTKEVEVDFVTAPGYTVLSLSTDRVKVKVSGAQPLLKVFKDKMQMTSVDLSDKKIGIFEVDMSGLKLEVPNGVKVLGVRPSAIRVEIGEITDSAKPKKENR